MLAMWFIQVICTVRFSNKNFLCWWEEETLAMPSMKKSRAPILPMISHPWFRSDGSIMFCWPVIGIVTGPYLRIVYTMTALQSLHVQKNSDWVTRNWTATKSLFILLIINCVQNYHEMFLRQKSLQLMSIVCLESPNCQVRMDDIDQ